MSASLTIGILACQGAFLEHLNCLKTIQSLDQQGLNLRIVEIRSPKDIHPEMVGLIIPGKLRYAPRAEP